MNRKKRVLILDPIEEPLLTQIFNSIISDPYAKIDYSDPKKKNKWINISKKISNKSKCKKLIVDGFIEPPATSRYQNFGIIAKKKGVQVTKEPAGNKIKFILDRKIF